MSLGIRTVRLGDTEVETTVLGFGCADLFREPSRAQRRQLLDVALDAGIRHFDVAPMYGLGLVERELGRFARGKRDRIVIATKFGIAPTLGARLLGRAQGPAGRLFGAVPALRERARPTAADPRSGAIGALLYRSGGFDRQGAAASLERSLRALRTDYVDVLLLHDPAPGDVRSDDVRGYLESASAAGRIRAWGVAGDPGPTLEVARGLTPPIPILQVRGDVFQRSLRDIRDVAQATIVFGVIGRALPRILAHVRSDDGTRRRWSDAVGADCGLPDEVAALLLRNALRANDRGVVLFGTIQAERIEAAATATRLPEPALDSFGELISEELGMGAEP